ncbi:hypothetical protein CRYUN_Cryun14cG0156000 [Craigia yunnanensis]
MEVSMRKALSLGILLITPMILLNTNQFGATSSSVLKDFHGLNATSIADNMGLEFLMDSEISRKLGSSSLHVTDNKAAIQCGRIPYKPCVGGSGKPKIGENCGPGTKNRNC